MGSFKRHICASHVLPVRGNPPISFWVVVSSYPQFLFYVLANSVAQPKLLSSKILTSKLIFGFNSMMKFPKATSSGTFSHDAVIQLTSGDTTACYHLEPEPTTVHEVSHLGCSNCFKRNILISSQGRMDHFLFPIYTKAEHILQMPLLPPQASLIR